MTFSFKHLNWRVKAKPDMSKQEQGYKVAVVGATGAVGEIMRELLAERKFPVSQVALLASSRSAGQAIEFAGKSVVVEDLDKFDFKGWDFALFSAGGSISAKYVPCAAKAGCTVIDNSSHFRLDPDIPLVVPEVNGSILDGTGRGAIIANPNCSTKIGRASCRERVSIAVVGVALTKKRVRM